MIRKEPEERFADGRALLEALETLEGRVHAPMTFRRPRPRATVWSRVWKPLALAALLGLLALVSTGRFGRRQTSPRIVLSGRVVDGNGKPVRSAQVTVDGHAFLARTTSDGQFRGEIVDAEPGEAVLLRVAHSRFSTETRWVTLASNQVDTLRFMIQRIEEAPDDR